MTDQTLRVVIGRQVRALREAHGRRQEDIAWAARSCGVRWTATRVAALERGEKAIPAEEFLLLPMILWRAGCGDPKLTDLLPGDGDEFVELGGEVKVRADSLRGLVTSTPGKTRAVDVQTPEKREAGEAAARMLPAMQDAMRFAEAIAPDTWLGDDILNAFRRASRDAEQVAARRLGVPAGVLAVAAWAMWGRGLSDERDARVAESSPVDADARSVQALRGRVTRVLYDELGPLLERYRDMWPSEDSG